jgi:hypothetical protein
VADKGGDFTVIDTGELKVLTEQQLKIEAAKSTARHIMAVYPADSQASKLAYEILRSLTDDA